jgi:hypothetical protein
MRGAHDMERPELKLDSKKTLASDGVTGLYRGFMPSVAGIIVYRGYVPILFTPLC